MTKDKREKAGNLKSYLIKGILGSGALRIVQALLALSLSIALARALGPDGYGLYSFAFSLVTLMAIPSQTGLPVLLIREVAKYQLKESWPLIKGIIIRANQATSAISATTMALTSLTMVIFNDAISNEKRDIIIVAMFLIPIIALSSIRGAALRGLRKIVQGQVPEMVIMPGTLIFLVYLGHANDRITPEFAMLLHIIAALLAFVIGYILLWKAVPKEVKIASPSYDTRNWARSVIPLSLIAGMQVINMQVAIITLGVFSNSESAGIYRVAYQLANTVALSLMVANMVIGPQISRMYNAGEMKKLQRMVSASSLFSLGIATPICIALFVYGKYILKLMYGEEFQVAYLTVAILCTGQLISVAMGSVSFLLNMTGHEKETAKGLIYSVVTNIVLNVTLVPIYGAEGAAIATSISLALWNIILYRKVYKILGIKSCKLL